MAKRIVTKIGDIFCVEVDKKHKRFFQYFCNDMSQLNSSVIRVFKKNYPMDYEPNLKEIVVDEVDFYAHTILRVGIVHEIWYKIGRVNENFEDEINKPVFGTCHDIEYINGIICDVDPNKNWDVWKINKPSRHFCKLSKELINIIEPGAVEPFNEIINRIEYGYYKYTMDEYNLLKRHPYPDVDSYVKKDIDGKTIFQHFKGDNVVQRIEVSEDGSAILEEGKPLPLPQFWETNWKYDEFITANEFKAAWKKYKEQS